MTAIPCPSCGAANVAGDQFCGSCGAPLPSRPAGTQADAALRPGPGVVSIADHEGAPTMGPGDDVEATPVMVQCPACGHANPAGRTFCKACGSGLPRMTVPAPQPVTGSMILAPAAPVAAPSAVPAPASSSPASAAPGTARRQGGKGWLILIITLGLAAGILWTLLPRLMAGSAPNEALPSTPNPGQVLPAAAAPMNSPSLEVSA